jgi:hypothetical protein
LALLNSETPIKKPLEVGSKGFNYKWLPGPDTRDEGAYSLNPKYYKPNPADLAFCIIDTFGFTMVKKGRWGGTKLIPNFGKGAA